MKRLRDSAHRLWRIFTDILCIIMPSKCLWKVIPKHEFSKISMQGVISSPSSYPCESVSNVLRLEIVIPTSELTRLFQIYTKNPKLNLFFAFWWLGAGVDNYSEMSHLSAKTRVAGPATCFPLPRALVTFFSFPPTS